MTPDQYTNKEFFIEVGNGHQLYVHDWGNPKSGTPVVCLHGGPGGSSSDRFKLMFDPSAHRVIFYDQRGCGKSTPYGSLEHNTTEDQIEDIEKIVKHLKISNFIFQGGSWGACLALAYALKYPKRVKAMVLFGIFTGSQKEIDYFDKGSFAAYFPDAWQQYLEATPKSNRRQATKFHFQRILSDDVKAVRESSSVYQNLEGSLLFLDDRFTPSSSEDPAYDPNPIRTEVHYLVNRCFLPDRYILDNAHKLKMPIWIFQGRYDMVCPPETAYELHQKLPNSHLMWTIAGHTGGERETNSLMRATLLQLAEK